MTTAQHMVVLLREWMEANGVSQAELARLTGRTAKHINTVLGGKAGTGELDYWAFVLGLRFTVGLSAEDTP